MPFTFSNTALSEVMVVTPRRFPDDRGWFAETYKASDFAEVGIVESFVQDNTSISSAGTLRGLHYQLAPYGQGKLVSVVAGRVWDVAVDIRRRSPDFGRWVGVELTAETGELLWVPPGFAHGFVALEDNTQLSYKCSAEYHRESERSIRWDDSTIGIEWPQLDDGIAYRLSEKDANAPTFHEAEVYP